MKNLKKLLVVLPLVLVMLMTSLPAMALTNGKRIKVTVKIDGVAKTKLATADKTVENYFGASEIAGITNDETLKQAVINIEKAKAEHRFDNTKTYEDESLYVFTGTYADVEDNTTNDPVEVTIDFVGKEKPTEPSKPEEPSKSEEPSKGIEDAIVTIKQIIEDKVESEQAELTPQLKALFADTRILKELKQEELENAALAYARNFLDSAHKEYNGRVVEVKNFNERAKGETEITIRWEAKKENMVQIIGVDAITDENLGFINRYYRNRDTANSAEDYVTEFMNNAGINKYGKYIDSYYRLGYEWQNAETEDRQVNCIVYLVEKEQPMQVIHVFPEGTRANLYETIWVDYWLIAKDHINNNNAAELAKSRIQKVNEMGFVFDRAEYLPGGWNTIYATKIVNIYGDVVAPRKSDPVIMIYYKKDGAVAEQIHDCCSEKKVDADSQEVKAATQSQANVATAPVTNADTLPATGVEDNAFLFLSSAALMALGIFFFKKQ